MVLFVYQILVQTVHAAIAGVVTDNNIINDGYINLIIYLNPFIPSAAQPVKTNVTAAD